MRITHAKRLLAIAASLLVSAVAVPALAYAQDAVVKGTITGPGGQPLEGAQVSVQSLLVGAVTDAKGFYSFSVSASNAKGQTVDIIARRLGFSPVTKQLALTAGEHTLDFALQEDVRRLDEIVVTGVAGATSMKNTTISISKVSEDQIQTVPAQDIGTALSGKVPGVKVISESGQPGSQAAVQIRGSTVLQIGNSQPTYIIDGVISKNGLATIDPQDIVSMEVLKGAASANTYGSQAANGIIAVTTRRGKSLPDGEIRFNAKTELGRSSIEHYVPLNHSHPYLLNSDGTIAVDAEGIRQPDPDQIMDNPFPNKAQDPEHYWRNQLQTWLQSNTVANSYLSMGYRKSNTNFMASFSRLRDPGIMPILSGFTRSNFRFNIDQGLTDKLDVSASLMYGYTSNDQVDRDGNALSFFSLLQAPPDLDLAHPNGPSDTVLYNNFLDPNIANNSRGNPLYDQANTKNEERRDRLFGSFTARYRPASWLALDATYGTDRFNRQAGTYQFYGYLNTDGVQQPGYLNLGTDRDVSSNAAINGTFTYHLSKLGMTTKLTYLYDDEHEDVIETDGGQFKLRNIAQLDAIDPTTFTAHSATFNTRSIQGIVTQGLNYDDRYLAQLVYVRDGSSLFGSDQRWTNFYGVSGAWRVSQDFDIPGIQELKLRAAVGTAGLRPQFRYQFETYDVDDGSFGKDQRGNPNLKPAIQKETEYGVNVSFLDRFDLELVNSQRKTTSAFLPLPQSVARAGGWSTFWANAATVTGKTFELALTTRVIEKPDLNYSFTVTGQRTRQHIDRLDAPPFQQNAGGQGQGIFYYREGEDLGVIYGTKWITDYAQLLDNPENAGRTLDDIQNEYTKNVEGYVVKKSEKGTPDEKPFAYVALDENGNRVDKWIIGNTNPDFTWGWSNTVRYKNFTVYGLLVGTQGGQIYNFTKQWMFQDYRHGALDQSARKPEDRIAYGYYANVLYNVLNPNSYFVEDGSFVKLRELSVAYQFSNSVLDKIGIDQLVRSAKLALIGRNLKTWTKYSGFDPEAGAGGDANFRIDGFRYPAFRTISAQIELGF
jgi:TonB-linked SusC/RagA family outer membrane protein